MTEDTKTDLKDKIRHFVLPGCEAGDLHEVLNQVCVDARCGRDKQLTALCAACIEEKKHSSSQNHQHR